MPNTSEKRKIIQKKIAPTSGPQISADFLNGLKHGLMHGLKSLTVPGDLAGNIAGRFKNLISPKLPTGTDTQVFPQLPTMGGLPMAPNKNEVPPQPRPKPQHVPPRSGPGRDVNVNPIAPPNRNYAPPVEMPEVRSSWAYKIPPQQIQNEPQVPPNQFPRDKAHNQAQMTRQILLNRIKPLNLYG